jgi:hypothetical protein
VRTAFESERLLLEKVGHETTNTSHEKASARRKPGRCLEEGLVEKHAASSLERLRISAMKLQNQL